MLDVAVEGFEVVSGRVTGKWIDVNGHINVASYLEAFDSAVVATIEIRNPMYLTE